MKPIYLEVQAFGSFANVQVLDFREVSKGNLFLIYGQTGAGKTTLFDAMCYALYDETTSGRKPKEMRSDYALPNINTRVRFVFSVGNDYSLKDKRYYFIEREIYQTRLSKKNEEELPNYESKQVFKEVYPEPNVLPLEWKQINSSLTKKIDIDQKVAEILKFSAVQFKQIVILPQGKFQELLTATKDEAKKEILIKIFNAEIYKQFTEILTKRNKEATKSLEEQRNTIEARKQVIKLPEPYLENLALRIVSQKQKIVQYEAKLPLLSQAKDKAKKQYHQAEILADVWARKDNVSQELAILQERASEINVLEKHLHTSLQAASLKPTWDAIQKDELRYSELKQTIDKKELLVNQLHQSFEQIQAQREQIEYQEKNVFGQKKQSLQQYTELLPKYAQITQLDEEIKQLNQTTISLAKIIENTNTQKLIAADRLQSARKDIEQHEAIAKQKDKITQNLEELHIKQKQRAERATLLTEYQKLDGLVKQAQQKLSERGKIKDKAVEEYEYLDGEWRRGQAFELASQLEDGKPCLVCGALHHPNPAISQGKHISEQDLNKAKNKRNTAQEEYETAQEEYNKQYGEQQIVIEKGKYIKTQLGEWADKSQEAFDALYQEAKEQLTNVNNALALIHELHAATLEYEASISKYQNLWEIKQVEIQQYEIQMAEKQSVAAILRTQLPEAFDTEKALRTQIKILHTEIEIFEKEYQEIQKKYDNLRIEKEKEQVLLEELQKQLSELLPVINELKAQFEIQRTKLGFQEEQDFLAALVNEIQREAWAKEITTWKNLSQQKQSEYNLLLEQTEGKTLPNVAQLATEDNIATQAWEAIVQQKAQAETYLRDDEQQYAEIEQLEYQYIQDAQQYEPLQRLAILAERGNEAKIDFQTHVLSIFLDEVLQKANLRLQLLSNERYYLKRTEEIQDGRVRKVGLDLTVFDTYSQKERRVQNLSGGETFFTSLALALGLADVAMAKAGGLHLDSIFIDEGFGTLDQQTLELAIRTLENLEGEFRLVGIISHVRELQERKDIPRVEIIKTNTGSRIEVK